MACKLQDELKTIPNKIEVVICPSFTALAAVGPYLSKIGLGAQDCCWEDKGAYTGEVSAAMLGEMGCKYVIVGHSERRAHARDTDEIINRKIKTAQRHGLTPILCVGETQQQRDERLSDVVVMEQLKHCLKGIKLVGNQELIVAYEPVWAIGTGKPVPDKEPNRVHRMIRHVLLEYFSPEVIKNSVRTIYGGSVVPDNVFEFTNQGDRKSTRLNSSH